MGYEPTRKHPGVVRTEWITLTAPSHDLLRVKPVWLEPDHQVSTARIVMDGHGLRVLAILDQGRIVGCVSREALRFARDDERLRLYIDPHLVKFDADTPVRQIAEAFISGDLPHAALVDEGRFTGMVFAADLLRELRRSWDPLTGLSWSDQLREWGVAQLRGGREITVIFIDMDEFGQVNKKYGHVVGDRALLALAGYLKAQVDPETDLLVRYGGDEFAIGTLRPYSEAHALAEHLREGACRLSVEGADQPVTFSVGAFGGRRTRERQNVHAVAMLDDLINNASRACTVSKHTRTRVIDEALPTVTAAVEVPTPEVPEAPIRVVSVMARPEGPLNQVLLRVGEETVVGVHAALGKPIEWSIALATARALERAISDRAIHITAVRIEEDGVEVEAKLRAEGGETETQVRVPLTDDAGSCVAHAVIAAFRGASPSSA